MGMLPSIAPHLAPRSFEPLPLGAIAPQGWLQDQLVRQASSLSGYISQTRGLGNAPPLCHGDSDVVNQSQWIGGEGWPGDHLDRNDQWFGYWANGNAPLVALLRTAGALHRLPTDLPLDAFVDSYMHYVVDHHRDGWLWHNGSSWSEDGTLGEGGFEMQQALLQWSEAQPQATRRKVATVIVSQLCNEQTRISNVTVTSWTATRWPTFVTLVEYVLDHLLPAFGDDQEVVPLGTTKTAKLLIDAAHRIAALGMDWRAYYTQKPNARTAHKGFPEGAVPSWNVYDHGVNNAEGALRWPNALYRINGSRADGEAALALVLRMLESRQGQVQSLFCADEVFCGRDPNRGTETCAVVEAMASLEINFATFGDPMLMDRVERLAFNALPGALTGDMWTHVYVQQANSVHAGVTPVGACDSIAPSEVCDRNFYGVSHFPCCITNFPQGWPKFAQSTILADISDSDSPAVVVASLVPVVAKVAAAGGATVVVDSQYPFEDEATVTLIATARTLLRIRVPGWAVHAAINGKPARNGTLHTLRCSAGNTSVRVQLKPSVVVEEGWGSAHTRAVAFTRGPLVFALAPAEKRLVAQAFDAVPARPHAPDWTISTAATWNYAIVRSEGVAFDAKPSAEWTPSFAFDDHGGRHPFSILVTGCAVSRWSYLPSSNITAAPPPSPIDASACGASEQLRLVPFGSTNIRIAVFPWVGLGGGNFSAELEAKELRRAD